MSLTISSHAAMEKSISFFTNKAFELSIISNVPVEATESLVAACEGMCELGFKFKVMPKGDQAWQDACFELNKNFPENFLVMEAVASNKEAALTKSQVVIFAGVPTAAELKMLQKKSLVALMPWPACEKHTALENFDAQQESGNCFLYTPEHTWDLVANGVRAFENYKFSYDWGQLKKRWKDTKIS